MDVVEGQADAFGKGLSGDGVEIAGGAERGGDDDAVTDQRRGYGVWGMGYASRLRSG